MDARHTLKCDVYKFNRLRNWCYRYTTFQQWCGFSISIGNSTGNATEPWILTNDQQKSLKWQISIDQLTVGFQWHRRGIELVFKSLDCFTKRLFHTATIFCSNICVCCLKLHQADHKVQEGFFFFLPRFGGGALSFNVFTICAVYWSLGRRVYFGVSNVVLVALRYVV